MRAIPPLDIEAAAAELASLAASALHQASACKWAARAVATYRLCALPLGRDESCARLLLAEHYREAALAHAAMGEDWRLLVAHLDAAMAEDRGRALLVIAQGAVPLPRHDRAKTLHRKRPPQPLPGWGSALREQNEDGMLRCDRCQRVATVDAGRADTTGDRLEWPSLECCLTPGCGGTIGPEPLN